MWRAPEGRWKDCIAMPSTHHSIKLHIVFSTKNRAELIAERWRGRLHAYLGGCLREQEVHPIAIGGVGDHVHLLIGLPTTISVAQLMANVKSVSSGWIHRTIGAHEFQWQEGYGVFSVSPKDLDAVRRYIENQPEHHRTKSFAEEYCELLNRAGVDTSSRRADVIRRRTPQPPSPLRGSFPIESAEPVAVTTGYRPSRLRRSMDHTTVEGNPCYRRLALPSPRNFFPSCRAAA